MMQWRWKTWILGKTWKMGIQTWIESLLLLLIHYFFTIYFVIDHLYILKAISLWFWWVRAGRMSIGWIDHHSATKVGHFPFLAWTLSELLPLPSIWPRTVTTCSRQSFFPPWINSLGLALNYFFRRSNQVDEIADPQDTMSANRELADEEEADDPRESRKKFVGEIDLPNCTLTCFLARCSIC